MTVEAAMVLKGYLHGQLLKAVNEQGVVIGASTERIGNEGATPDDFDDLRVTFSDGVTLDIKFVLTPA